MQTQFQFLGFEPDHELRVEAQHKLERLLDQAPYGSFAVAVIEKMDQGYRCAIDIYTINGPFVAQSQHTSAGAALNRVMKMLTLRIERWREKRMRIFGRQKNPSELDSLARTA